ncbi:hypothetical protein, partial [Salmonella enterica]|uniref:hypothetical protein n=1 Tax=Salmonella enterica TaxID=28901 RepID=UPI003AF3C95B
TAFIYAAINALVFIHKPFNASFWSFRSAFPLLGVTAFIYAAINALVFIHKPFNASFWSFRSAFPLLG